jgi:hypothetical protein
MTNITGDEATYSTRLQLEIQQRPSLESSAQLGKDLEKVIEYRTTGQLTATEFFVQLKKIEYSMERGNGKSREAFLVFIDNELSLSHASKETVAHVTKLLGRGDAALNSSTMSEASECCAISWRAALLEAERDAKTGRIVSLVLVGCFVAYMSLTKIGAIISEAKFPFGELNAQRSFWDLATDSVIRVTAVLNNAAELAPMILGTAGAALNLFRRGVRNFEINMMFKEQVRGAIAVHLAIGAWSGFLASYLLRYLTSSLTGDAKSFLWIVGCFAAGYSSWFIDAAIDKVSRKLDLRQRPNTSKT